MNPENILDKVCRARDIASGLGTNYEGLFPSIIDRSTHQMMVDMPPAIAGQRDGAVAGSQPAGAGSAVSGLVNIVDTL